MFRKSKLGLALGGGAARGLAHIGVLRVFEKECIPIDLITGTSMGALIGALYALHGRSDTVVEKLRGMLESLNFKEIRPSYFDEDDPWGSGFYQRFLHHIKKGMVFTKSITQLSLISEKDYRSVIGEVFGETTLEELKIPFGCVATDVISGHSSLLVQGPLTEAICASCAIPGILPPICFDGQQMVDGGLVENIPIRSAKEMGAKVVVGVNVAKAAEDIDGFFNLENGIDVVFRAHDAARNSLDELHMKDADVVIRPSVEDIHWSDFSAFDRCIDRGEEAAKDQLKPIKEQIRPSVWKRPTLKLYRRPSPAGKLPTTSSRIRKKRWRKGNVLGLALGGGVARALAHIGLLRAIERRGIQIDIITGTSMGALLGALYLLCSDSHELEKKIRELIESQAFFGAAEDVPPDMEVEHETGFFNRFKKYIKKRVYYTLYMTRKSYISKERFEDAIEQILPDIAIEELPIPFGCVALDLISGKEILLTEGSLRKSVSASSAIPGVFPPVELNGRLLIDGSWIQRDPIELARSLGADLVIASHIGGDIAEREGMDCGLDIVIRTNDITRKTLCEFQLLGADLTVRPEVSSFHWTDFSKIDEIIKKGEEAILREFEEIHKMFYRKGWRKAVSFLFPRGGRHR
jgi:NTE family protein